MHKLLWIMVALIAWAASVGADTELTPPLRIVAAARAQIGVTLSYDGSYKKLEYPMGDVPIATGVCTDVVIRALREIGIDLQRAVREDRLRHADRYPRRWRNQRVDSNIDHRRVPNLQTWFAHHTETFAPTDDAKAFQPGDIVSWKIPGNLDHIGIVSDRSKEDRPLIIHNIGRGAQEEDVLFAWTMTAHYRLKH